VERRLNNDYFRFLRKCFNDCRKGIENFDTSELQDFKSLLNQKFYIDYAEPYLMGGMFISLGFLDTPEILFETVIYSYVDVEKETVTGYTLRSFKKSKYTTDFTKKDILKNMREHPELKLW